MKKFFSFVGLVAAMTIQAASYSEAVMITMTCAGGSETQNVMLFVDPAQATVVTSPNLATLDEAGQVNLYAIHESGKYSSFKANAISDLALGVVTNRRDVSYTFNFDAPFITDGLTLTDLRSEDGIKTINITNGGSYTFTVAGDPSYTANTNSVIADRFIINYSASSVEGICFNYNHLIVTGYAGSTLKVEKAGVAVVAEQTLASDNEDFDLSAENGRLVVTLDGVEYQIDANPAVTPVP